MAIVATGIGRRITNTAIRCQNPSLGGLAEAFRTVSALTRWPRT